MNYGFSTNRKHFVKEKLLRATRTSFVLLLAFFFSGCGNDDNSQGPELPVTVQLIATDDVFVFSQDPDEAYNDGAPSCPGCGAGLKLSPDGGKNGVSRVLLRYPLDQIPSGSQILSASLRLKDLSGATNNSSDCVNFVIQEITTVWSEYTATWNNQPRYSGHDIASGVICGETFDQTLALNTTFLQNIVNGGIPNGGLVIIPTGTGTYDSDVKVMPSKEGDNRGIILTIKYQK